MDAINYFKVEGYRNTILTFSEYDVNRVWEAALKLSGNDTDKIWIFRREDSAGPWWVCNVVGFRKYREIVSDMDAATDPTERRFFEKELANLLSA